MAKIKSYVTPSRLYRYRSLIEFDRELDAIENSYLYCSEYSRLNDPMEGLYGATARLRRSDDYKEYTRAISNVKMRLGICSFSEVYDHELMWAHYADQFRGICIAYDFYLLQKQLADEIVFVRMYYDETIPRVGLTTKRPEDIARRVLSQKNYRWLYEREWRMFALPGMVRYHDPQCVARVYLGFRMSKAHRKRILSRLNELDIQTRTMSIDEYSMSFETPA